MKVLVGSKNPVKVEAVKEAFLHYFDDVEVIGVDIDSGVRSQPVNEETYHGAFNRANNLKAKEDADFYVGVEGGIKEEFDKWFAFTGVCVMDKNNKTGYGATTAYELPMNLVTEMLNGVEMGILMDRVLKKTNLKQKGGALSVFSKGKLTRKDAYVHGVMMAMFPFINQEIYANF